jgi:putative molybdopterin biosynthesis protein
MMKESLKEFLTVRETASLLNLNEKKVYALAAQKRLPGTKITGKWLFPRFELEQLIKKQARSAFQPESPLGKKIVLLAGSDDPVLSMIHGLFHARFPEFALFTSSVGSGEGLKLLKAGFCHAALSHLYDQSADDYTFPFLRGVFERPEELVLINLFYRSVGFVAKGDAVDSFRSVAERGLRFVNRQTGSGIRGRIDAMIAAEGLETSRIRGYADEVYTHVDVADRVLSGEADAGIAAESVARLAGFRFSMLFEERFDMVTYKEIFFEENVQVFVEFLRSEAFKERLERMHGYDCSITGKVLYPKGES